MAETSNALCEVATAVHTAYRGVGWSEEWAAEDSGLLAAQHVTSVAVLRKSLERGHLLLSGMYPVSLDILASFLRIAGPRQALQFPAVMCRDVSAIDWHALSAVRITSLQILSVVSRESWTRAPLPAGVKVAVEDLATAPLASGPLGSSHFVSADTGGSDAIARPLAAFLPSSVSQHPAVERSLSQQLGVLSVSGITPSQTPGRLVVTTADQRRFEIDRYCPHKGADLAGAAVVDGHVLCPRHRWRFSLDAGGMCANGKFPCTLNARAIEW